MQRRHLIATLGIVLLYTCPIQAGLYQTLDPPIGPVATDDQVEVVPFKLFQTDFQDILSVQIEVSTSDRRKSYLQRLSTLQQKEKTGTLSDEDRVNLSECLVRLGQHEQAVAVLMPRAGRDCRNFMILANLATANQLAGPEDPGRLQRAVDYLEQALSPSVWPREWKGISPAQLQWYRRAETFHHDLLRQRQRQALRGRSGPPTLDALFGPRDKPVRFVGDSGQYEAGKLAAEEREKLPKDAPAVVQQLLIWMPQDTRLYWLLGELLNAEGDVQAAQRVFRECMDGRRFFAPDLKEHRQIVNEWQPPPLPADANGAAPPGWLPETRQLYLVGGLAGLVVLALAYFQVREMLRRRRADPARKG